MTEKPVQTFVANDGRTLLFSCDDFVNRICLGDACFICGASPDTTAFNDEHIVPRWLLRRYGLFEKEITLPTKERRRYGGYRVQCCAACNTILGDRVENPVSRLLDGDFAEVFARLQADRARELIFVWMCLLFLKVHLKDNRIPVHRDRRRGSKTIGDLYDWIELHHIHAVARSPYTGAGLMPGVIGSFFVVEVIDPISADGWDFVDLTFAQTIGLRVGNVGIVAVLNDSGAAQQAWSHRTSVIDGAITGSQFREIVALFAVANDDILVRPEFGTIIVDGSLSMIFAQIPRRLELAEFDSEKFGHALLFALGNLTSTVEIDGSRDPEIVAEKIRTGRVRFLVDENFNFKRPNDLIRRKSS